MKVEGFFSPFHSERSAPSQAFHHSELVPCSWGGGCVLSAQRGEECRAAWGSVCSDIAHSLLTVFDEDVFEGCNISIFNLRNLLGELQNLCLRLCNRTGFLDCCNMCTPMVLLLIFWIKSCVRSQMAWEHLVIPTTANTSSHKKKKKIELWFHRFCIS